MIKINDTTKALQDKLEISNIHALPRIEKVVLNVGIGQAAQNEKFKDEVAKNLATIAGQKPAVTKAKIAISGFKIRQGDEVGLKVTLRGKRMYSFIERLSTVVLPRIRDFHGVSIKKFDKQGNYTFAFAEQVVFPEIPYDQIQNIHGVQITFTIRNSNPEKSKVLLELLGIPFEKNKE